MTSKSINISSSNSVGKCDLKCTYNFEYKESNSSAKNLGEMIQLTYENSGTAPVSYNGKKYTVQSIRIFSPSIHLFNSQKVAAEVIVTHLPQVDGPMFSVGIPVVASEEVTESSSLLKEIIEQVGTNAPKKGETTTLSMSDLSLQTLVPSAPFFSYSDLKTEWVVFGSQENIGISDATLKILSQIIRPSPIIARGGDLFYNSAGPNTTQTLGDGIYISCQPTGASEEEIPVSVSKNATVYDTGKLLDNKVTKDLLQIVVGIIITLLVLALFGFVYGMISGRPLSMPSMPRLRGPSPE